MSKLRAKFGKFFIHLPASLETEVFSSKRGSKCRQLSRVCISVNMQKCNWSKMSCPVQCGMDGMLGPCASFGRGSGPVWLSPHKSLCACCSYSGSSQTVPDHCAVLQPQDGWSQLCRMFTFSFYFVKLPTFS